MPFYGLQIWTGHEARFLAMAGKSLLEGDTQLLWPRRRLRIRKAGVWRDSVAPIFPGYIFIKAAEIAPPLFSELKRANGFIRFLPSNENISPLNRKDQDLLSHFLSFGEVVEKSKATFDENQKIRIISGPLKNLEGRIIRVDRRKGRARVRLEMYADAFEVDFGFDAIDVPPAAPGK